MGRFSPKHKELASFKDFLTSIDSGFRSSKAADAIVTDISKCVHFISPKCFSWGSLMDETSLRRFMDMLQTRGVGPQGQLGKLTNICHAITYVQTLLSADPELRSVAQAKIDGIKAKAEV